MQNTNTPLSPCLALNGCRESVLRLLSVAAVLLIWTVGYAAVAATSAEVPAGNSEAFYRKCPQLDDFFPYYPFSSANATEPRSVHLFESWNDCYFNIIMNYDFFQLVADMPYSGETSWYVEKSLGITPAGKAYFDCLREHRLKTVLAAYYALITCIDSDAGEFPGRSRE